MEITNEIKAKVFAQYLGQKVELDNGGSKVANRILCAVGGIDDEAEYVKLRMGTFAHAVLIRGNSTKLILKPLSEISDEDAIECLNILMGSEGNMFEDWHESMQNHWLKLIKVELVDGFGSVQMNMKPYFSLTWIVGQYLVSKGYDIKQAILGGKTLKESGLAIYEK